MEFFTGAIAGFLFGSITVGVLAMRRISSLYELMDKWVKICDLHNQLHKKDEENFNNLMDVYEQTRTKYAELEKIIAQPTVQ